MSAEAEQGEPDAKKRSRMPLILGLALALGGAAGGYAAVSAGLVLGPDSQAGEATQPAASILPETPDFAFVPLEPMTISLPSGANSDHLRFRAELEVSRDAEAEVGSLRPRVMDVLNGYLRAVDVADLEDHRQFPQLRAQMLRRVQIVTGPDAVRNLLITEFVLN